MKEYTLISCVGTGMYKPEGGYSKTRYQFPDGRKCETKSFLEALLRTAYRPLRSVILVGTKTSGWDMLIDETDSTAEDLLVEVGDSRESKAGIGDEALCKLEAYLSERWVIPFSLIAHDSRLDADTAESVFASYTHAASKLESGVPVLLDITHGFRSMPVLLYQAIQFSFLGSSLPAVELVYGEYVREREISFVRDLSAFWQYAEITAAISLFEKRLNAHALHPHLTPLWDRGAKAVKRFSDIVECNASLQLPKWLPQMRNALQELPSNAPPWLSRVSDFCTDLCRKLDKKNPPAILLAYAELLIERGLMVQAVITLQTAIECAIALYTENADKAGDYEWWKDEGRSEYNRIKDQHPELKQPLSKLEGCRNQIAHGGGENARSGSLLSVNAVPDMAKRGMSACKSLFAVLGMTQ